MFSWSGTGSSGSSPVWVTVLTARFAGGLLGGYAGVALLRGTVAPASSSALAVAVPILFGALVTGGAISILLPPISGRSVALGNAVVASFAGALVPLIAGMAFARSSSALS